MECFSLLESYENRVIVITGCARGLGKEIAIAFSELGAKLALFDKADMKELRIVLDSKCCEYYDYCGDMTNVNDVVDFVDQVYQRFGHVDILVNNAGIHYSGDISCTEAEDLQKVLEINVVGNYMVSREILRIMKKSEGSRIIFISSSASFDHAIGSLAYSCSKAALDGIMRSMAKELALTGITVNSINPTVISTEDLNDKARQIADEQNIDCKEVIATYAKKVNLQQRLLEIDEVVEAILYVSSQLARGITGTCMLLNCGSYMR